jgi:hypothetical protein
MGFLHGIGRAAQVIKGHLDIRVIDRLLENLAIHLEKGSSNRFGLAQHSAERPLKGITFYRALDSREEAKLPLRTGLTRFLRKPDV